MIIEETFFVFEYAFNYHKCTPIDVSYKMQYMYKPADQILGYTNKFEYDYDYGL